MLLLEADDKGTKRLWTLPVSGGMPSPLTTGGAAGEAVVSGQQVIFTQSRMTQPPEVFTVGLKGGTPVNVSKANESRLAELDLPQPESVTFTGAEGTPVQMWIVKPPGFDPAKRTPLVFWVHGGPQGAFMDSWSTRWNVQLWAAQGYVLALPYPRGSTDFGQKFTDQISRDWGGRVYQDLMAGLGQYPLAKEGLRDLCFGHEARTDEDVIKWTFTPNRNDSPDPTSSHSSGGTISGGTSSASPYLQDPEKWGLVELVPPKRAFSSARGNRCGAMRFTSSDPTTRGTPPANSAHPPRPFRIAATSAPRRHPPGSRPWGPPPRFVPNRSPEDPPRPD